MSWLQRFYELARPLLFRLPAEGAHHLGLAMLRFGGGIGAGWQPPEALRQRLLGCDFPSPVGLAAGFDKDARALRGWQRLGFGFAEVGTVTPLPQSGNPRPRLRRLVADRSLQNWMGFNGRGVDFVRGQLLKRPVGFPVGANIGKNAATAIENASEDYCRCSTALAQHCDFLVLNVSSPNTPGLRTLQRTKQLTGLLRRVRDAAPRTPLLVKLSPDEEIRSLEELSSAAVDLQLDGIVVNNTSVDYGLASDRKMERLGGLSGGVLRDRSRQITAAIGAVLRGRSLLISVGGIDSAAEAWWRIRHGADLVEIYTGLVYEGPDLPRRVAEGLAETLAREGVKALSEVTEAVR